MESLKHAHHGSVLGSALLIAGCCIGAGMLGLPVLSAHAGFIPSSVFFFLVWLFMMTTGLLLLEVNLWFKDEDVSIISMAGRTLGTGGRIAGWILFCYLFYSVMVAYVAGSGSLFAGVADDFGLILPRWLGSVIFTVFFGVLIYFGTEAVDWFNRFLMIGLVASYFSLLFFGVGYIEPSLLTRSDWPAVLLVIPAMVISFGYHNLIPSLTTYLHGDSKKLIGVVVIGSLIPLAIYLAWESLILGIVPIDGFQKALDSGEIATLALKNAVHSKTVILLAQHFAFFALISSFLSVALSFLDFLADGLHIKKDAKGKLTLCLMTLTPPFILAMIYPGIFLVALSYAGAFGAVILFGIMPALMVWRGRYRLKTDTIRIVPGGRTVLSLIIGFASWVVLVNLLEVVS